MPLVEFAYNCAIYRNIGMTPFEVVYNNLPIPLDVSPYAQDGVLSLDGDKRVETIKSLHKKVGFTLERKITRWQEGEQKSRELCLNCVNACACISARSGFPFMGEPS